jgi:hypothetical protein
LESGIWNLNQIVYPKTQRGACPRLSRHNRLKIKFVGKKSEPKNRRASVGAGPNSVAETFSLSGSLSSPQQPIAITQHSTKNLELVNARKLADAGSGRFSGFHRPFCVQIVSNFSGQNREKPSHRRVSSEHRCFGGGEGRWSAARDRTSIGD